MDALAHLEMYRGRYAEAIRQLELAARLLRREGPPAALFDNLVAQAAAFVAIGGRTRASDLIDEAFAILASSDQHATPYFHLGHLMARIGRINGARETLRLLSARLVPSRLDDVWAERALTASVRLAERNPAEALVAVSDSGAPPDLEPFRLALIADANAMNGQYDAAIGAARRLANGWHFGGAAQDEWMRAALRIAKYAEASGDTAAARAAYQRYVDRWKEADVFVPELNAAQRSLLRLGGKAVAASR
jgi:tetratricopeptide (TPR) repeat protein